MAQWGAKFVKCPFYRRHDQNKIVCEGLEAGNTINLAYESSAERSRYMHERCNSIEGCKHCPIHALLDRKWEEGGA